MVTKIAYYVDRSLADGAVHEKVCQMLRVLQTAGRVNDLVIAEHREAFALEVEKQRFLEGLRDFSMRHQVGLARVFGSRSCGFWYLPPQFLLVYEGDELQEVFPCRIGGRDVEILDFLDGFASGKAWTTVSAAWREGGRHRELVDRLAADPGTLGLGITLKGVNVPVSLGFAERGIIDAVFQTVDGGYLLVEVKAKPEELDKAIGQILRHRKIFTAQNEIEEGNVEMAIACPFIPNDTRKVCESIGIRCVELGASA